MPVCHSHRPLRRSARRAFTLIELLLVLVILAILATTVALKVVGRKEQAQRTKALTEISNISTALSAFEIDNGRFPRTDEGLAALVQNPGLPEPKDSPSGQGWKPLLDKVPVDPWGHPYVYRCPGTNGKDFDLFSCGPSGQEGSADNIQP